MATGIDLTDEQSPAAARRCRSDTCCARASTTLRSAMASRIDGLTSPRCRFIAWTSRSRCAAWRSSPPPAPYRPDERRPGARRALQRGGQVLQRLLRRRRQRPRPAHLARGDRSRAHHGRGHRHLSSAAAAAPRCGGGTHRRAWPLASTACPPTAATAPRIDVDCVEIVARCKAGRASMQRSWCPTARCATRA